MTNLKINRKKLRKKKFSMTKEMRMICSQVDTTKCVRPRTVLRRINGSHQITRPSVDSSQRMMTLTKRKVSKMRTRTTMRKALSRMMTMMAAITISDEHQVTRDGQLNIEVECC